jgi:hypothetical protein
VSLPGSDRLNHLDHQHHSINLKCLSYNVFLAESSQLRVSSLDPSVSIRCARTLAPDNVFRKPSSQDPREPNPISFQTHATRILLGQRRGSISIEFVLESRVRSLSVLGLIRLVVESSCGVPPPPPFSLSEAGYGLLLSTYRGRSGDGSSIQSLLHPSIHRHYRTPYNQSINHFVSLQHNLHTINTCP